MNSEAGATSGENPLADDGRTYGEDPFADDSPTIDEDSSPGEDASDCGGLFDDLDPVLHANLIKWLAEADARDRERARQKRLREFAAPVVKRRRSRTRDFGDQRGASPPIGVRFPVWLDEQLRGAFQALSVTPSEGVRQILEEWMVVRLFPDLEYRDPEFLRLPAIRGGPTIVEWLVSDARTVLAAEVQRQVEDYCGLARARFEEALRALMPPTRASGPRATRAR